MDPVAQLRICQFVSSILSAKDGFLVDVHIPIIVIVQHYQAAHHSPHQLLHFLLRKATMGTLPFHEGLLESALQVLHVQTDPIILAAYLVRLPRLDLANLYKELSNALATQCFPRP
jgi:hypothetical protein